AFAEPLDTPRRPLMLFGAGHVGRAIAALVPGLPLSLAWFDSRAEADAPGVVVQDETTLVACAGEAKEDAAVLILTHDHGLDYRLTAAALRSAAGFVGLIGSATKRARFVARLAADGVDPARLTCPIGVAGIHGKEPGVIAIAAMAQLLALDQAAA
uniref:XdhC family protein n=1 Tax=Sphingomonas bacterium TaxID=1895847 RepID=UPI001C2D6BC0